MRDHIMVSGQRCEVRTLSVAGKSHYGRISSPKAEVFAPEGFEFSGGESSLMAHTAADLDSIEKTETLEPV